MGKVTKQQFEDFYCKEGVVVNCKTREEAWEVLSLASQFGYVWSCGSELLSKLNWELHQSKTCYRFDSRDRKTSYADTDFYLYTKLIRRFQDLGANPIEPSQVKRSVMYNSPCFSPFSSELEHGIFLEDLPSSINLKDVPELIEILEAFQKEYQDR